jgi:hypothetical protein
MKEEGIIVSSYNSPQKPAVKESEANSSRPQSCLARGLLWTGRIIVSVGILLLIIVAILWVRHDQKVALPTPTGPYVVGRSEFDWIDSNRLEPFSKLQEKHRELMVWVWYPTDSILEGTKTVEYLPARWRHARQEQMGLAGKFLAQNPSTILDHAYQDVPVSRGESSYPVIIMQPGLGPLASDYATIAEDLASHGYIVFASTPTYSSSVVVFHDGRVVLGSDDANISDQMSADEAQAKLDHLVEIWAQDNIFIMNQVEKLNASDSSGIFTGRLSLDALGTLGHSFGGASALQTCSFDSRCRAGVDLDGTIYGDVVKTGVVQPFLFLWSETSYDAPTVLAMSEFTKVSRNEIYQFNIKGMQHLNFSDYGVEYQPALRLMGALGSIDGQKGLEITAMYITSFFDFELKKIGTNFPGALAKQYPEVKVGLPTSP